MNADSTGQGNYIVTMDELEAVSGDCPSFIRGVPRDDDPAKVAYLDGWAVEPTGDYQADLAAGRHLADHAIQYAREQKDPNIIWFVLTTIHFKALSHMLIPAGNGMEAGFQQRISQLAYLGAHN
jgi:hypothetical protein